MHVCKSASTAGLCASAEPCTTCLGRPCRHPTPAGLAVCRTPLTTLTALTASFIFACCATTCWRPLARLPRHSASLEAWLACTSCRCGSGWGRYSSSSSNSTCSTPAGVAAVLAAVLAAALTAALTAALAAALAADAPGTGAVLCRAATARLPAAACGCTSRLAATGRSCTFFATSPSWASPAPSRAPSATGCVGQHARAEQQALLPHNPLRSCSALTRPSPASPCHPGGV